MVERHREDQVYECGAAENIAVDIDDDDSSDLSEDDDLTTDGGTVSVAVASIRANEKANFGNIAVSNSTDVHFGNKTFYQGPVTIKQFVYSSKDEHISDDVFPPESVSKDVVISPNLHTQDHVHKLNGGIHPTISDVKSAKTSSPPPVGCLKHRHIALLTTSCVVVVLLVLVLLIFMFTQNPGMIPVPGPKPVPGSTSTSYNNSTHTPTTSTPVVTTRYAPSGKLRILTRNDWLAQPPSDKLDDLKLPVPYVIISHTATEFCTTQSLCVRRIRDIQSLHIDSNGWSDIGYNFIIGGDIYAYEGRGWDKVGAHSFGYNVCSIGISFIGTFNDVHPPEDQIQTARLLIEEGVRLGKIRADYRLIGHRQVSSTKSPGDALFADIKKLPHFSDKVLPCLKVISDMDEELRSEKVK